MDDLADYTRPQCALVYANSVVGTRYDVGQTALPNDPPQSLTMVGTYDKETLEAFCVEHIMPRRWDRLALQTTLCRFVLRERLY
jgi:hypothetical protein